MDAPWEPDSVTRPGPCFVLSHHPVQGSRPTAFYPVWTSVCVRPSTWKATRCYCIARHQLWAVTVLWRPGLFTWGRVSPAAKSEV